MDRARFCFHEKEGFGILLDVVGTHTDFYEERD
jgi:hypothetical protein